MTRAAPVGIDIGGTGIKAGPVDLEQGHAPRRALACRDAASRDSRGGRRGRARAARSIRRERPARDHAPVGRPARRGARPPPTSTGRGSAPTPSRCSQRRRADPSGVVNDADAAGMAEIRYGAGKGRPRRRDPRHARHGDRQRPVRRRDAGAELRARPPAPAPRRRREVGGRVRARARRALLEGVGRPGLRLPRARRVASCGRTCSSSAAASASSRDKFLPLLECRTQVVAAQLHNDAGIVGRRDGRAGGPGVSQRRAAAP